MNISKKTWILVLLLLLVILAGCKKTPTKTVYDVPEDLQDERSIVDAQGNVLFSKELKNPGAPLGSLFLSDDDVICRNFNADPITTLGKGGSGMSAGNCNSGGIVNYIRSRGAKVSGDRITPFYPINQVRLNNNLLNLPFWIGDESMRLLLDDEIHHLRLSNTQYAIPDRSKEFFIEDERVCIQGGQMISNLIYHSHENPACHNKKSADCKATFREFPLFKSCLSLTDLRQTFMIPSDWESYSVSCGFNENFATLPSLIRGTNVGFSNCIYKNLENLDQSIVTGFGVGNPTIEAESSELSVVVDDFFRGQQILQTQSQGSVSLNSRTFRQEIVNYGKGMTEDIFISKNESTLRFVQEGNSFVKTYDGEQCDPNQDSVFCILRRPILTNPQLEIIEQWHIDSEGNNILSSMPGSSHRDSIGSDNYLFLEYNEVSSQEFNKYIVTLTDNTQYFVYINPTTKWFAVSNYDFDIESSFNQEYFDSFYTPERLYVQKQINGKVYTLTEESEALYFKSGTIFEPESDRLTTPIYLFRIQGATSDMCQELFGLYDFKGSNTLSYDDHLVCKVDGGVLNAKINERLFSDKFSENNLMGAGYVLLRNIIFPLNNNIGAFS